MMHSVCYALFFSHDVARVDLFIFVHCTENTSLMRAQHCGVLRTGIRGPVCCVLCRILCAICCLLHALYVLNALRRVRHDPLRFVCCCVVWHSCVLLTLPAQLFCAP